MMHMLINVHELNFGATIATGAVVELVSMYLTELHGLNPTVEC